MKDEKRIPILIALWLQRPPHKRTSDDLGDFYRELERDHPELLKRNDDPYRRLKRDLLGHVLERKSEI